MAGPADLFAAATELLTSADAALQASPGGPPKRVFVAAGVPAWDCPDQLTVHVGGPHVGETTPLSPPLQTGHRITVTGFVPLVTLTITMLRCVPVIQQFEGQVAIMPAPDKIQAASEIILWDEWAIWNHLANEKRKEILFPPKDREFWLQPVVSLNTAGGIGGFQLAIEVALGGYREGS